jgi:hypothetical protein
MSQVTKFELILFLVIVAYVVYLLFSFNVFGKKE